MKKQVRLRIPFAVATIAAVVFFVPATPVAAQTVDTDNDGYVDAVEIENGFSPRHGDGARLVDVDSDGDGLNDAWELKLATDPQNPDSDGDGYRDGAEVTAGYDPRSPAPAKVGKRITVDLAAQRLTYFFGATALEEFPISGGLAHWPTPRGKFKILAKVPVKHYGGPGFDYPNTKWNLHFTTAKYRYYIHGAYWHNDFGQPKSHGCVNVAYANMERLYAFAQIGTAVEVT